MKVLLINGSPHKEGCTYTALCEVADELKRQGVDSEIFWLGVEPLRSCMACGGCAKSGRSRCVFGGDVVNEALEKMESCDGIIVGSPVHYAGPSGQVTSFLGRMFYSGPRYCRISRRRRSSAAVGAARARRTR